MRIYFYLNNSFEIFLKFLSNKMLLEGATASSITIYFYSKSKYIKRNNGR